MKIEKEKNKIVITIDSKADRFNFELISKKNDMGKYIDGLFNLDYEINGSDDELFVYETNDSYKNSLKDKTKAELFKLQETLYTDIINYIGYLYDAIPDELKNGFNGPESNVINIPSNDIGMHLKLFADRIQIVSDLIYSKN